MAGNWPYGSAPYVYENGVVMVVGNCVNKAFRDVRRVVLMSRQAFVSNCVFGMLGDPSNLQCVESLLRPSRRELGPVVTGCYFVRGTR